MRLLRSTWIAALALLTLGVLGTSTASAEEGVLPNLSFTGSGGEVFLEFLTGDILRCTALSILEGKFLTEKEKDQHGTATLDYTGCMTGAFSMHTLGDATNTLLIKVLFLVCLVEPKALVFGLLIAPVETEHIEAFAGSVLYLAKGALIAELEGKGLTAKEFKFKLSGAKGDQTTALKCEINGKTFKHSFEFAQDTEAKDQALSEEAKFTIKFEKEVTLEDK
jgi:hypothetical protein